MQESADNVATTSKLYIVEKAWSIPVAPHENDINTNSLQKLWHTSYKWSLVSLLLKIMQRTCPKGCICVPDFVTLLMTGQDFRMESAHPGELPWKIELSVLSCSSHWASDKKSGADDAIPLYM